MKIFTFILVIILSGCFSQSTENPQLIGYDTSGYLNLSKCTTIQSCEKGKSFDSGGTGWMMTKNDKNEYEIALDYLEGYTEIQPSDQGEFFVTNPRKTPEEFAVKAYIKGDRLIFYNKKDAKLVCEEFHNNFVGGKRGFDGEKDFCNKNCENARVKDFCFEE